MIAMLKFKSSYTTIAEAIKKLYSSLNFIHVQYLKNKNLYDLK